MGSECDGVKNGILLLWLKVQCCISLWFFWYARNVEISTVSGIAAIMGFDKMDLFAVDVV